MSGQANPDLLGCPFCGSKPEFIYRRQFKEYFVHCTNLNCRCTLVRAGYNNSVGLPPDPPCRTTQEAATHWNTRFEACIHWTNIGTKEV